MKAQNKHQNRKQVLLGIFSVSLVAAIAFTNCSQPLPQSVTQPTTVQNDPPPNISFAIGLTAKTTYVNTPVAWSVLVSNPSNASGLQFKWYKDSVLLPAYTGATLYIPSAQLSDRGTYEVRVSVGSGTPIISMAFLDVQTVGSTAARPVITTQPQSVTAQAGAAAQFTVQATGTPAPQFKWLKGTSELAGKTSDSLAFSSLTAADAGNYSVVVYNSAGAVTSAVATLTVTQAQSIGPVIGFIDGTISYTMNGVQQFYMMGWACAKGYTGAITVQMFNGPYTDQKLLAQGLANYAETDTAVNTACETTGAHRFYLPISANVVAAQMAPTATPISVHVYGLSATANGPNVMLPRSGVQTIPANFAKVIGHVDRIEQNADGSRSIIGWACARGVLNSLPIHFYVNGFYGAGGTFVSQVTADQPSEPAVGAQCDTPGANYRFQIPLTNQTRSSYPNAPIYVFGLGWIDRGALDSYGMNPPLAQGQGELQVPAGTN